jgi:hypothetical protein
MAQNERQRQQKLARKAAKRKERAAASRRAATPSLRELPPTQQMALAQKAPVHECLVPENLFSIGIGNVIFSRRVASHQIAMAAFLVDVYCLGIKNAYVRLRSEEDYEDAVHHLSHEAGMKSVSPECLRKLVEDADAYARDLGFSPHPDYYFAARIFAEIDAGSCTEQFEFGKDGKPFYVSGPHETPAQSRRIVDTLMKRCGPGGYHFLAALTEPPEGLKSDDDDVALPGPADEEQEASPDE